MQAQNGTNGKLKATIARNVRKLRILAHLSKYRLAKRAGLGLIHLSRIERGSILPGTVALSRLAGALHVSLDRLVLSRRVRRKRVVRSEESEFHLSPLDR